MAQRHGELVHATLDYLTLRGHWVFPVPNRGVPVLKRGEVKWIRGKVSPGVADICGCTAHGRFVAVEVKVGKDKLRYEQERFKAAVEQRGGLWLEVRDTTQALIDAHGRGEL